MLRRPFESALAALVGVMDHAGCSPLSERHVERLEHQFGAQIGLHRPAHDRGLVALIAPVCIHPNAQFLEFDMDARRP